MRPTSVSRWLLAASLVLPAVALAADTHPFSFQDLVLFNRITESQVSPDGKQVVFAQRVTDLEANKGRTDLWLVNIDGSGLKQLTVSPESESNPRWSPDGKAILFLSARGGSSQIWLLPLDGGESRKVTQLPLDVDGFNLSPDGKTIVFAMQVFTDCSGKPGCPLECTKKRMDAQEARKASGRLYTELLFRHWDEWMDGRRNHLFAIPVAGGEPVDLLKTMAADAPSRPFGGTEEFAFTPDGKGLVFTARNVGREEAWSTNLDLFFVPLDGSAAPKNLTEKNRATDTSPVFSPDGKTLAYKAMSRPGYEADRQRIILRSWPDGAERELAPAWDRSPDALVWSSDGRTIFTTTDDLGQHPLLAIDVASGQVRQVVGDGQIDTLALAGERLLFGRNSLTTPSDLFSIKPDGTGVRQITQVNRERLAAIRFGQPEQFSFTGAKGDKVYVWIVKPVDFDPAKKYPMAFLIHGGPQGSFGNDFHYRWNPQAYAGRGYVAVMVDFHGSTGYGQKFTDAINGDWGGAPFEDLVKGFDAAVKKYPFIDPDRACALGASYGGFMINWIAGAWPDRFRCLVSHDGNLDEQFAYFDTEELWFPEWEHAGTPWDNPVGYQKHNPLNLVKNWKTPIMVVHGGRDFRVVETQGMATFTAAQRRGIPSQFLHFPDENHWVLKPQNSLLWHETVLAWLDRWTK